MDGVVDAESEYQRRHGRLQGGETRTCNVENAVGPNERTRQTDQREHHARERTERNGEHRNDDHEGQHDEEQQVIERALVDVVSKKVVGNDLIGQEDERTVREDVSQLVLQHASMRLIEVGVNFEDPKRGGRRRRQVPDPSSR